MFHTKVRTKAAFAELGHDVFQTSQALRNRKKEVSTSWVKSTPRTNCWGKHKTYEHKELLPAFAVEGLLPYKQSSFGPLRHCFESYITIDQEAWFLIYVLSLCYVMLHHKNTPNVFIDCSSGLPVAKAATVRRKKSMELEASWSSHKFWAWPMGFPIRFDGNRIRCHTCSFPCEISIFSNKAPWQSVISESFNSSPTMLQRICLFVYRTSRSESIRIFQSAKTPVVRVSGRVKDPMPRELPTFFGLIPSKGADHVLVGTKHTNTNIHKMLTKKKKKNEIRTHLTWLN